jgi:HEAT repeat protein
MLSSKRRVPVAGLVVLVLLGLAASVAVAQETGPDAGDQKTTEQLWDDLLHYIKVARTDAALSSAQAILDSGASPREIYLLSVSRSDSLTTLARGSNLEGLGEPIARIRKLIEDGYEALRSDTEQIAESIRMLGGTLRSVELATQRLQQSGEYALPQLIQTLADSATSDRLKERIVTVLPKLGKESVRGLSCALQTDDPRLVEYISSALGQIEYPHAAPRLREVLAREDLLPRTAKVVRAALIACAGQDAPRKTPSELFYQWSRNYYYQQESIMPDLRYDTANVWYWKENLGLVFTPVPREIFPDVYAMRLARLSLKHNPSYYPAVPLWLSAIIRKEVNLPADATDPTTSEQDPSAAYYVLASSPKYLQAVLSMALDDRNPEVAFRTIEGLAQTAGAQSLVQPVAGGAQPLVSAMSYPDRRVRFLAALSLARALPEETYTGKQIVITVLNEALRQTGTRRALVVVGDQTVRNRLMDATRGAGFVVVNEPQPVNAIAAAQSGAGMDVVVMAAEPDPADVILQIRRTPVLSGLPVVIAGQSLRLRELARSDPLIVLAPASAGADEMQSALDEAMNVGVGRPLSPEEAAGWAIDACDAIHRLGLTDNGVYDITRTQAALIEATRADRGDVQVAAAEALSVLSASRAQRAIAELASGSGTESVAIGAFQALTASLRRFGHLLTDEQTQAVVDLVTSQASLDLRNAAAQALGAMDLPSEKIKDLILRSKASL